MNYCKSILLLVFFAACQPAKKTDYTKIKADHEARMTILKTMPDPLYAQASDSAKHWFTVLKNVYLDDQKYRIVGYNMTREEWDKQKILDSQNLQIVTSYLDKHGWPSIAEAGLLGKRAVGIVIQHAPLKVQETYYPVLVEAYKRDTLLFETLALMEDRINMRNHRAQYYGSQVVSYHGKPVLYPLKNIDSIEIYRQKIGFRMNMPEYLKLLKVNWDPVAYKRLQPELLRELKVSDTPGIHFRR